MFAISTAKSLLAAAVLSLSVMTALPASEARADVDVDVGIGIGTGGYYGGGYYAGGYGGGYDGGHNGYRREHRQRDYDAYVSCRDGQRILWRSGYSRIELQSCRGGFYRYTAWRNGRKFLMAVDARVT